MYALPFLPEVKLDTPFKTPPVTLAFASKAFPSKGKKATRFAGATSDEFVKPPATGGGSPLVKLSSLSTLVQLAAIKTIANNTVVFLLNTFFIRLFLLCLIIWILYKPSTA